MVNGMIEKDKSIIKGTIDIRTPITIKQEEIIDKLNNYKNNIEISIDSVTKPLYYEENTKLVKSLMKAYKDVTKDYKSNPKQIGGSTYAKVINNCIAFGCEFTNDNNIHNINEKVKISELLLQVELYIHAIIELVR